MPEHTLFYIALLCQILLISLLLPRRIASHVKQIFKTYPRETYPKLYPRPAEHYERSHRNFRAANWAIAVVGLALLGYLLVTPRSGEWDHAIALWYFLLQTVPVFLLDLSALREARLMREASRTRKADLQPRRFLDVVSPALLGWVGATYVAFALLIAYVDQFDFPWFGGYWNLLGVTIANLLFAGMIYKQVRGRKLNPHQSSADRMREVKTLARIMAFISIAATVFTALNIALAAAELRHLQPAMHSLYFQLLAVVSFRAYLVRPSNFEVFKADSVVG
jgi:hypothetical protein